MSQNPIYSEIQSRAALFGVTPHQLIRALIRQDNKTICKAIFKDMEWDGFCDKEPKNESA